MEADFESDKKFPCIVRAQFEHLGTDIDIQIVAADASRKDEAEKDIREIRKLYFEFTKIFSRFDQDSELSKLNYLVGKLNAASLHVREIVALSLEYNKKTYGFYDPRILDVLEKIGYADDFKKGTRRFSDDFEQRRDFFDGDLADDLKMDGGAVFFGVRMDFSGIAKGYINDKIVEFLVGSGRENFLVDSGGDMFMQGVDESGEMWTVNVEGIAESKLIFVLDKKGIATSGIGRRRWEIEGKRIHHIINPKNPQQFSFDLKSVSVIAENTTEADVWAKTLFLMGKENGILYAKENGLAAVILDSRGSAWISPKAKEFVF